MRCPINRSGKEQRVASLDSKKAGTGVILFWPFLFSILPFKWRRAAYFVIALAVSSRARSTSALIASAAACESLAAMAS